MLLNRVSQNDHVVTEIGKDKPQKLYLTGHVARRRCEEDETCLWDTVLPGFGLRRYITGRKSWFLRYVERGVARNWTIGDVKRVFCGRREGKGAQAAQGGRLARPADPAKALEDRR